MWFLWSEIPGITFLSCFQRNLYLPTPTMCLLIGLQMCGFDLNFLVPIVSVLVLSDYDFITFWHFRAFTLLAWHPLLVRVPIFTSPFFAYHFLLLRLHDILESSLSWLHAQDFGGFDCNCVPLGPFSNTSFCCWSKRTKNALLFFLRIVQSWTLYY